MNMSNRPRRNPSVVWRDLDGETAIISPDNKKMHMLNEVGSRIWLLLDGEHDLPAIVKEIADEFSEPEDNVQAHVAEYLGQLRQLQLLEG